MPGRGLQNLPLSRIPLEWDAQWFEQFCKDVLAFADTRNAIEGSGITITGNPDEPATISASADLQNLLLQQFVVASASGFLQHERTLAGEATVVSITDGGDNANITVGLVDGGVTLGKLKQLSDLGVLGNPTNAIGAVQNILPDNPLAVMHSDATNTSLVFDTIDHTYVSDFDEAAQDAVGGILTDSTTIDFSYNDGANTITAAVIQSFAYEWTNNHGWADNAEVQLGTGNDLRLYHDGTNSFIRNDTGLLKIQAGTSVLAELDVSKAYFGLGGSSGYLAVTPTFPRATVDSFFVTGLLAETQVRAVRSVAPIVGGLAWGAALSGAAAAVTTDTILVDFRGTGMFSASVADRYDGFNLQGLASENWSNTQRGSYALMYLTPNGATAVVEAFRFSPTLLRLTRDSQELQLGASQDLRLYHDGTNSFLRNDTGVLALQATQATADIYLSMNGGRVLVSTDNLSTFMFALTGSNAWVLKDNGELQIGAGPDLRMFHDGTNSFIQNDTGDLRVRAGANVRFNVNATGVSFNGQTPIARPDYTVTNPTTNRSIDVAAITHANLAQVVGTLIQDLIDYGLLQ